MVNVVIKRMRPRPAPFASQEGAVGRWVVVEVLEVFEGKARLWPNAAELKDVSDERDGSTSAGASALTVGVDEIPDG